MRFFERIGHQNPVDIGNALLPLEVLLFNWNGATCSLLIMSSRINLVTDSLDAMHF